MAEGNLNKPSINIILVRNPGVDDEQEDADDAEANAVAEAETSLLIADDENDSAFIYHSHSEAIAAGALNDLALDDTAFISGADESSTQWKPLISFAIVKRPAS